MKKYISLIIVCVMLQSCNGQENIDQTISRLDDVDFTLLEGTSIYFRSKGHRPDTNIYFLNVFKGKCSPYSIEVDKSDINNLVIKNDLVLKSCGEDYLDAKEIKKLIKEYLKLDICLVQVDAFGNVYLNPNKQEAPTLLKISQEAPPKDLEQFERYQNNWYTRK